MKQKGTERRPLDHLALANSPRVKRSRRTGIRAYAAIVGTPPHEISDVKATDDGKMVQRRIAAMIPMKMIALRGWPFRSTVPIHFEPGRIPSRAIAKMSRDAAVTASDVLIKSPIVATVVMTTWPPRPSAKS